jgi:hypothetical protein
MSGYTWEIHGGRCKVSDGGEGRGTGIAVMDMVLDMGGDRWYVGVVMVAKYRTFCDG